MSYKNKIICELSNLKKMKFIKSFSTQDMAMCISFTDRQKPIFIKPTIDEKQVTEYLKTCNSTAIEVLRYIASTISSTKSFPTQKQISDNIYKDNTTVCKIFAKFKNVNLIYKDEDGKYQLSELNNKIHQILDKR